MSQFSSTSSSLAQASLTKVTLITGAARRIGACLAETLHAAGHNICIHYRSNETAAIVLQDKLNQGRKNSAICIQADLNSLDSIQSLAEQAINAWGRIDVLINNASSFFPTPFGTASENDWDDLLNSNLKGPYFLTQALAAQLQQQRGCVLNMIDIHAARPLKQHSIYCIAKAGLAMMTKSLAKELAPQVRVNGIAPGAILWPEESTQLNEGKKSMLLDRVALGRCGQPEDIARTVFFLIEDAPYITGQIINVDGGRTLHG